MNAQEFISQYGQQELRKSTTYSATNMDLIGTPKGSSRKSIAITID